MILFNTLLIALIVNYYHCLCNRMYTIKIERYWQLFETRRNSHIDLIIEHLLFHYETHFYKNKSSPFLYKNTTIEIYIHTYTC